MTNGRDGRLIHADSHFAASSPDMSLAGVVAAVIVERGQPRQGCDGLAREQAQLLQVDKQYAGHLRPDAHTPGVVGIILLFQFVVLFFCILRILKYRDIH